MRILIVASYGPSLINFRGPMLATLVSNGHQVWAAAPLSLEATYLNDKLAAMGVRYLPIRLARGGLSPFGDIGTLQSLYCLLGQIQPDLVFAYTIKPVIYVGLAIRLHQLLHRTLGIRFLPLITGLGYAFTGGGGGGDARWLLRALLKVLYFSALRPADVLVFQNPDDQAAFHAMGLVPPSAKTLRIWGSGVDLEAFTPHQLPNAPIFLMLSRLLIDKGVREYVEAARRVRTKYPLAVFRLAGMLDSNPAAIAYSELQSWIAGGDVEYLGDLSSVKTALQECRIYVLPSYREGTPRSVLEAMATRRPILTTDVPGCRETVVHGVNGFLVPPRDPQALAEAMCKMIEQPEALTQSMAQASLALARERYDVHKVNDQLLEVMGA
jgi:glycosyltransferase involved in cell wall biosynthesis